MIRYLDDDRIAAVLDVDALIDLMEQVLVDFSAGRVEQPVRSVFPVEPHGGHCFVMPAFGGELGVKVVNLYPGNADRGLSTHLATILLFEADTGALRAVLDGTRITEMRTAAVSAAATRLLARPQASTLAILGSGAQARSHLEILRRVRPIRTVRAWSPTPDHLARFVSECAGDDYDIAAASSAREAVTGTDIVVTATATREPVLQGAWLTPGCHVNAVGAPRPDQRELDDDVLRDGVLFVDSRAAAAVESGDVILSGAKVYAEIGEALAGTVPSRAEETTVFKSLGMAIEDVATAAWVERRDRERSA